MGPQLYPCQNQPPWLPQVRSSDGVNLYGLTSWLVPIRCGQSSDSLLPGVDMKRFGAATSTLSVIRMSNW